jgi:hypothetical protein
MTSTRRLLPLWGVILRRAETEIQNTGQFGHAASGGRSEARTVS